MLSYYFNKMTDFVKDIIYKKEEPKFEKPYGYKNINSTAVKVK